MLSSLIQIELNALCLLLLIAIVYQSRMSIVQQMSRLLFRTVAYGIILELALDIVWLLVEGHVFPGAIMANRVINAFFLGIGVCLGCLWYLYVLNNLGYVVTRRVQTLVMTPGLIFLALNIASIWTGWFFFVTEENIYVHGSLFWLQSIGAYGMLLVSFVHTIVFIFLHRDDKQLPQRNIQKLLKFYGVTVVGSIVSLLHTGMPGTWTCASISIVLIYLGDQNREILNGMITAMAADYRSIYHADLDKDECICVRASERPYGNIREGASFSFREGFAEYAEKCVDEASREAFLQFVDPENIRAGLANEAMLSHRYMAVKDGVKQYEMLRIAGVRTIENREDHVVHAIGAGFSDVDRETRLSMEQNRALTEALEKAEEANAAKTSFLNTMSHEIRTPMNAIIGLDNIALRDPNISTETRDELEKIGSSARHLLALINDILDMSRIETGRMELKTEIFSLREMVEQINIIINGQCEDKRLTYEFRLLGKVDEYFIGDNLRIKQILINILGNAVKFSDPPGTVTFIVEETDYSDERCMLHFTMKDTGVGMDEEFIPRLFEPFSQEDSTITNRYGGSGLGMAITKKMVDLFGGEILVESKKGCGTTFTVNIPLQRAQSGPAAETPDAASETDISVAGLHVLIVEDMELNAEILTDLLEMEEISSEWAENGKVAVDMFAGSEEGHFDAILMDMRMPVMDGLTATQEIRKLERPDAEGIPIIALTANAFEEDVQQCLQAGMDAHLSKPVDIDDLRELLGRLLPR